MDYPIENCTGGGLNQLRRLLPRRVLTCLTRNPWPLLPRHGVAAPVPWIRGAQLVPRGRGTASRAGGHPLSKASINASRSRGSSRSRPRRSTVVTCS